MLALAALVGVDRVGAMVTTAVAEALEAVYARQTYASDAAALIAALRAHGVLVVDREGLAGLLHEAGHRDGEFCVSPPHHASRPRYRAFADAIFDAAERVP